jgi:hypothetical protein
MWERTRSSRPAISLGSRSAVDQVAQGLEEFELGRLLSAEELHVFYNQQVAAVAEAFLELVHLPIANGARELVGERLR